MTSGYKQQVIDFFNQRTAYDQEGDSHPHEAQTLLAYVPLRGGQTVLDLATGTGLIAIPAAQAVAPGSVIGVDFSDQMLAQAQQKMNAAGISTLKLIPADVETVSFSPQQFDVIFCCSALVYVCDLPALLKRCYAWLKSGGCFAFTTPTRHSHQAALKVDVCQKTLGIDLPHIIRPLWTEEKCQIMLQQAGFQSVEITTHLYNRHPINPDEASRLEVDFYPRGNPLSHRSKRQLDSLHDAYQNALKSLAQAHGNWQASYSFYVKAFKP